MIRSLAMKNPPRVALAVVVVALASAGTAHAHEPSPAPAITSTAWPLPAADVERIRKLGAEVTQLRQQRSQLGLTLPILTMAGGVVVAVGGLQLIYSSTRTECTYSQDVELCTTTHAAGGTAAGVAVALVGAGGITFGLMWMLKRLGPRRELANQIQAREREMILIRETPRWGFVPTRDGGGLFTLAGRF
jgi:hypothetical protein